MNTLWKNIKRGFEILVNELYILDLQLDLLTKNEIKLKKNN